LAKAEFLNPGGSIKDRAAKGIIAQAEKQNLLKPGGTIVEGTAGNTGSGLATLAAERGYKVIVSMPDNQSSEKYEILKALGAEVRAVPAVPFSNPNHFYHQAKLITEKVPNSFWANQFENTANGDFHYKTTGPEIWEQSEERVDVLVLAVGTGGTISGVSRFLKEKKPKIRVTIVDPFGSGLFCYLREGKMETSGSSITEGIGIMRITENFKAAKVDDVMRVSDQSMINMLYHVAKHDGILVGMS
jgi:cysteine synthase A